MSKVEQGGPMAIAEGRIEIEFSITIRTDMAPDELDLACLSEEQLSAIQAACNLAIASHPAVQKIEAQRAERAGAPNLCPPCDGGCLWAPCPYAPGEYDAMLEREAASRAPCGARTASIRRGSSTGPERGISWRAGVTMMKSDVHGISQDLQNWYWTFEAFADLRRGYQGSDAEGGRLPDDIGGLGCLRASL